MTEFKAQYQKYLDLIEDHIAAFIARPVVKGGTATLLEAMKYSLLNGGKRIRPVLTLAVSDIFGVPREKALPFACAIEMIHASSLIHDDLPALDNDDLRRGKPSNHKVYGEAMAVIGGDALMNYAYEVMLSAVKDAADLNAARYIARCAGINGMLGGQAIDIVGTDSPDEAFLYELDRHKTAMLIKASVMTGELLSGGSAYSFSDFAEKLGLLFQFTDDVLDVIGTENEMGKTIGKDAAENKITAVSVFGISGAMAKVSEYEKDCLNFLKEVEGSEFLQELVEFVAKRRR